ncbi:adenylosuccinate lyase [Brachyspira hyodysenteriae]|uniref:adenylosuccinate lyase n=1 Tax=Brachyspira hyodysenteriae TaxID=159 RepID=UPI00063DD05B|nr:adenylosuccinate lyase [Brachyspira hyodysenteriae]KLI15126.1 adenylosuccinate lyase [Brachyspira hyodysenteriae]MBT8720319.1 adenylosuccinate lyase [Brachyspira hyodysenteriae]MBT8730557.1 adenylosuccinate lyase [Brachyspira hyodysenteriae]MBT8732933.1 adenylosuccinate lyase [Brachyspira hyodysenteriae]MBT8735663.1 adenylosuccinate lyase [Brachyspira hyodysenteriae]
MIKRYTRKEMGELWSLQNEFQVMLDVEIAACEAMAEIREIPQEAVKNIKEKATFTVERIAEIEKETNHDIISFVTAVQENVGEGGQYIHKGLTSSDVKDTALAVMMKRSAEIILDDLKRLSEVLLRRAKEHKYTPCIGRTHGIHAEPMTLGLKFILWYDENERNIKRVEEAKKQVSVGKLSGAVGTYSNIDPRIEEIVCKKLGIEADKVSTQIIQRDRHAQYLTTLAIVASSLEKFATEIRNLQRTDIREAEEYFSEKQKGSSAMPHKRNPITCERISGLARIVRGNALASMEDITLWHERDISHSSVERVILPDSTIAVDYAINKFIDIVDKLLIYPEAMKANIEKTGGLIFSQRILISLVNKGIDRDNAYRWVQRNAMKRWLNNEDFRENVHKDEDITKYLSSQEIDDCFDYAYYLRNIDVIMKRFGI